MGNEFNKTEADFAYERYTKMGGISEEQDIPLEELPLESALASHDPAFRVPVDFDNVVDDGSDPALVGDPILAADIGLNAPEPGPQRRADRNGRMTSSSPPERDELLESDAILAAGTAGLTGQVIDYAEDEERLEDEDEELPLEDIPDADELEPGTEIDPASPDLDAMPGTDVLNGSNGEED